MPIMEALSALRVDDHKGRPIKVHPGDTWLTSESDAADFERRGLARRVGATRVLYETRVVTPEASEVRPDVGTPFHHVPVLNTESSAVGAEGDSVLPDTDLAEQGTADSGRRGRRSGFDPRR